MRGQPGNTVMAMLSEAAIVQATATRILQEVAQRRQTAPAHAGKPRLLDELRQALRSRHYSPRTEQTYCHWVRRSIHFHNVRHPAEMAESEINSKDTISECYLEANPQIGFMWKPYKQ